MEKPSFFPLSFSAQPAHLFFPAAQKTIPRRPKTFPSPAQSAPPLPHRPTGGPHLSGVPFLVLSRDSPESRCRTRWRGLLGARRCAILGPHAKDPRPYLSAAPPPGNPSPTRAVALRPKP